MYEAVLFDMDGVLLEGRQTDPAVYEAAAERVLREFGVDPDSEAVAAFVDPGSVEAFRGTCERVGVDDPAAAWERREAVASSLAADALRDGERAPYPDVAALHDLDGTVGIVSNNRHETVSFAVEQFGWPCEVVHGRDPTLDGYGRLKPDPHYLERALDDLGTRDAVYVGDRYTDVDAAAAVGVDAVLLAREDGDPGPRGDAEPTARVDSLDALHGLVA